MPLIILKFRKYDREGKLIIKGGAPGLVDRMFAVHA